MKPSRLPVVVALVTTIAVSSTLSLGGWLWGRHEAEAWNRRWAVEPVVVASRALSVGDRVTASDLRLGQLPGAFISSTAVRPGGEPSVLGQPLTFRLQRGELVTRAHFGAPISVDTCVSEVRTLAFVTDQDVDSRWHALLDALARRREAHERTP